MKEQVQKFISKYGADFKTLISEILAAIIFGFVGVFAAYITLWQTHVDYMAFANGGVNMYPLCKSTMNSRAVMAMWWGGTVSTDLQCIEADVGDKAIAAPALFVISALMCSVWIGGAFVPSLFSCAKYLATNLLLAPVLVVLMSILTYTVVVGYCWNSLYMQTFRYQLLSNGLWETYQWDDPWNPPCFWMIELLEALYLMVYIFTSFGWGFASSVASVRMAFKFVAPAMCLTAAQSLYGYYMPTWYSPPNTDEDRILLRLLAHTALMEAMSVVPRNIYRDQMGQGHFFPMGIIFITERFSSLYSRLLVNAVSDEVLQIVSAVVVGIIEIFMRLTVGQRDRFFAKLSNKLQGKSGGSVIQDEAIRAFRSEMIMLQTMCEVSDMIIMSAFFCFILLPEGPLQHQLYPFVQRSVLRGLGFKVEEIIMQNTMIQLVIELATDSTLVVAEKELGIIRIPYWDFKTNQKYMAVYSACFVTYSLFFVHTFSVVLFVFPLKKLDKYLTNRAQADLLNTWFDYLPNAVETEYIADFLSTL